MGVFGCSDFVIFEIIVISDFRLYRFAHLRIFRFSDSRKLQSIKSRGVCLVVVVVVVAIAIAGAMYGY